ncbi:MAG: hypothetical protein GWP63_21830, partial [Haliea sp.]|nr:hypothetical protein [Haliea sp.]
RPHQQAHHRGGESHLHVLGQGGHVAGRQPHQSRRQYLLGVVGFEIVQGRMSAER